MSSSTSNKPGPANEIIESTTIGGTCITLRRESGSDYRVEIAGPHSGSGLAVRGAFHGLHKATRIYNAYVKSIQDETENKAA